MSEIPVEHRARPPGQYGLRARLRTVGATALFTSLLWVAFIILYWPRTGIAPAPEATAAASRGGAKPAAVTAARYPLPTGQLQIPVAGVAPGQLVDTFTQARAGGARPHDAIDIMAPRGTPVMAAGPGRVEKLFLSQNGGTTLYERSADGRAVYYYAHLDGYAPGIVEGMALAAGQPIAFVGSSGDADPAAPHLHFAVMAMAPGEHWWQGQPVNPYPLLGGR